MVIRKKNSATETIEEMKFPKWLNDLMAKKWFLYLTVAVMIVLVVGFSLPANTRTELVNSVFAKGPPSGDGVNIPPVITGTATSTSTPEQEKTATNKKLKVEYVNGDSTLKLSEIELGKIYIEPANPPNSFITGAFFIVDVRDIPIISSITVGETTLSNFRIVQTAPKKDIVSLEWDIASGRKFSISMATLSKLPLSQENMVDGGPAIEISGQNNKLGRYGFNKWSQARYVYITVNSP